VLKAAALVPLLVTLATASVQSQTPTDSATAASTIRAALADWVAAANRNDWKAAARVWAPDLVGWYPGQPDDTYTREMERLAHSKPARTRTHYAVDVIEVMVSGPMAVVRDIWRFTSFPSPGDSTVAIVRSYEVWRRQPDNQWKIARWISAPEPPQSR
jgi:ketosteroid isomerase-like protein